ncbi:transcriptional regulator GfcR [Halorubrum tebenquichense]|uniref:Transcriptional regulator GfcR n=1 Tax=Halorubrum tebenquichense DSM 14210 TaxID=1227485 RepID=M0DEJ8_9EURY|nr:transcriptional regulator GfcR [Halorubrum tebenquichense]ELZ33152.1 orotate phosphoribosyltransferase-like protein [Halorubrum tebenquichense DSM 14210]
MKNVDDLISDAASLANRGMSKGEIADELNVSRETASWLVARNKSTNWDSKSVEQKKPHDIHVDWSAIGRDSTRLTNVGNAMADIIANQHENLSLTVGIEKAGTPLATTVAQTLDTSLAAYTPRKHQWEKGNIERHDGSFSRNFARVSGRECCIIDDTITSGTTMYETIESINDSGGNPVAAAVLIDKQGVDSIDGVPVYSLIDVLSITA